MQIKGPLGWSFALLLLVAASTGVWAQCADGDNDGICDDVDPCTNLDQLIATDGVLRLRKLLTTPFALRFSYAATVPQPIPPDPLNVGLRLVINDVIDVTIPPGAYDPIVRRGWTTGGVNAFRYRDSVGVYQGIIKVKVKQVDSGVLRVSFVGKNGFYYLGGMPMPPTSPSSDFIPLAEPASVAIVFDPPTAVTGSCADGVITACRFRGFDPVRSLICLD